MGDSAPRAGAAPADTGYMSYLGYRPHIARVFGVALLVVWVVAVVLWARDFEQAPTLLFSKLDTLNAPYLDFMRRWYGVNPASKADFKYSLADLGCDMVDPNKQTDPVKKWVVDASTERMRYKRWPASTNYVVPRGYTRNMPGAMPRNADTVNHDKTALVDATPYYAWTNGLFRNSDVRNGTLGTVQLAAAFPVDFKTCFHLAMDLEDFVTKVVFALVVLGVLAAVAHAGKMQWLGAWYAAHKYDDAGDVAVMGAIPLFAAVCVAYLGNYLFSDQYDACKTGLGLYDMHGLYMFLWVLVLLLLLYSMAVFAVIMRRSQVFGFDYGALPADRA